MKLSHDLPYSRESAVHEAGKYFTDASEKLKEALGDFFEAVSDGASSWRASKVMEKTEEWEAVYLERQKILTGDLEQNTEIIPVNLGGKFGYYGRAKMGVRGRAKPLKFDRSIRFYKGVTAITGGSRTLIERASQGKSLVNGGYEFYMGHTLLIKAGEWYEFEIRHNNYFIAEFLQPSGTASNG
jgi:hypothetical protein